LQKISTPSLDHAQVHESPPRFKKTKAGFVFPVSVCSLEFAENPLHPQKGGTLARIGDALGVRRILRSGR
jgi:hypothetical protein